MPEPARSRHMSSLRTVVNGLDFPNPFLLGASPKSATRKGIEQALQSGWGGVVCKTIGLAAHSVRYGQRHVELVSERPFDEWIGDFQSVRDAHPEAILVASIYDPHGRNAWAEMIGRCQEAGISALELNFSGPKSPEAAQSGTAIGESVEDVEEVCSWVMETARVPVWVKLTPNVVHIDKIACAALRTGCHGISAINTIPAAPELDLKTLRPKAGSGSFVPYSGANLCDISLRMCIEIARAMQKDFADRSLSGIGGISTGAQATQFILLGCNTVQVCSAVMRRGYRIVEEMKRTLLKFMEPNGFETLDQFRGFSLQYFRPVE